MGFNKLSLVSPLDKVSAVVDKVGQVARHETCRQHQDGDGDPTVNPPGADDGSLHQSVDLEAAADSADDRG